MGLHDLAVVLADTSLTWAERRTRLQGWRGCDVESAGRAGAAQRLAPAACAVGAFAGAAAQSPLVLSVFAATALVGTIAPHHPFESVFNRWASGRGRPSLPPNRAAKRLGCAMGVVLLGGAAVAYAGGAATLGLVLALILGGTAAFVAATGICIPSMLFTLLWGAERATAPSLVAAAGHRRDRLGAGARPIAG